MSEDTKSGSLLGRLLSTGQNLAERASDGLVRGQEVVANFATDQNIQRILGLQLYSCAVDWGSLAKYHGELDMDDSQRLEVFDAYVNGWKERKDTRFEIVESQAVVTQQGDTGYNLVHLTHPRGDLHMFEHIANGKQVNKVFFSFGYEGFVGSKPLAHSAKVSLENYIAQRKM